LILSGDTLGKKLNKEIFPGIQGGPLMHVIAAKAVAFKLALADEFKQYQHQIVKNAAALAGYLMDNGIRLVSSGTDNHMMLVDLSNLGITGKDAENRLEHAGITVNKNTIPFDTQSPFVTSGIRIGTPAVTTRGMREAEMEQIGGFIVTVLKHPDDESSIRQVKENVTRLCANFPLFP
jgi:glycine hydroxymethyltransferase